MPKSISPGRRRELEKLTSLNHTINGGILFGLDGYIVEIQARAIAVLNNAIDWRAAVKVSGMARGALSEALDRIRGSFAKLRIPDPEVEILVNLAPADLAKEGTWLDLPLAIILLQAAGYLPDLPDHREGDFILMGELGIHGEIRRVPGALSIAYIAKKGQKLIVPAGNERECALIMAKPGHEGCGVYPTALLEDVIQFFKGNKTLDNALKEEIKFESLISRAVDFGKIKGQDRAKKAAIISAAGGHNMLMIGPPGEGKSLLASAIPGILPRLGADEKVELTKIYSACGELPHDGMAVTRRPFRAIHHTASKQAIIGGGSTIAKPGEITLAHHGVLFLDEIAEFSSATLESLRQPIESGEVNISRVGGTLNFPCRFTLVAAMNPCPCGYYGTARCKCNDRQVQKYQSKISGPILDRIDLQVELQTLTSEQRFANAGPDETPAIRDRVEKARGAQSRRFAGKSISCNAAIPGGAVREYCDFSTLGFETFREKIEDANISTRSMDRLAKVSRTIADLNGNSQVEPHHVNEAASFVIGGMLRDATM